MKRGTTEHPKMKKLARCLNINRAHAIGILESLWHWAGKFAQQGNIGRHDDVDIAEAVFWEGDPSVLVAALLETHWIDKDPVHRLVIHDWEDHADDAVRKYILRHKLEFIPCRDIVQTESGQSQKKTPLPLPLPLPLPEPIKCKQTEGGFPTLKEVTDYASMQMIPEEEAVRFWNHFESVSWIDKNGHAITRWQSKLATWKVTNQANGPPINGNGKDHSPAQTTVFSKELDRVIEAIRKLEDGASRDAFGTAHYGESEKMKLTTLKTRRKELRTLLGVSI